MSDLAHASLISSASFTAVWSFHRTNIALGFSANSGSIANGVPLSSVKAGVEPVVSKAIPTTFSATSLAHCPNASVTVDSSTSR